MLRPQNPPEGPRILPRANGAYRSSTTPNPLRSGANTVRGNSATCRALDARPGENRGATLPRAQDPRMLPLPEDASRGWAGWGPAGWRRQRTYETESRPGWARDQVWSPDLNGGPRQRGLITRPIRCPLRQALALRPQPAGVRSESLLRPGTRPAPASGPRRGHRRARSEREWRRRSSGGHLGPGRR